MRSMILGGCLATVAAGGVYFVATGGSSPTHCGPCISRPTPEPADPSESPPVVEVVNVAAELAKPAAPPQERFVSFDEPPLAKQLADRAKAPDVIQASFEEPAPGPIGLGNFWAYALPAVEVAPMPRPSYLVWTYTPSAVEVAPTPRPADPMPLAVPDNPY